MGSGVDLCPANPLAAEKVVGPFCSSPDQAGRKGLLYTGPGQHLWGCAACGREAVWSATIFTPRSKVDVLWPLACLLPHPPCWVQTQGCEQIPLPLSYLDSHLPTSRRLLTPRHICVLSCH